jgi:hypothetical protein
MKIWRWEIRRTGECDHPPIPFLHGDIRIALTTGKGKLVVMQLSIDSLPSVIAFGGPPGEWMTLLEMVDGVTLEGRITSMNTGIAQYEIDEE